MTGYEGDNNRTIMIVEGSNDSKIISFSYKSGILAVCEEHKLRICKVEENNNIVEMYNVEFEEYLHIASSTVII